MQTQLVEIFFWRILAIFLAISAFTGVSLGLLLIFKPHHFERVNHTANRWISLRKFSRVFDRSVRIEHFFYRHHRVMGMSIVFAACYIFIYFGTLFDKAHAVQHLAYMFPPQLLDVSLDVLVLSLLTCGAMVLLVGIFLWMRPSLLRGMEEEVNQWITLRKATKFLDVSHYEVEFFMLRHLRRVGWLLFLGSAYLFFILFGLLV